MKNFLLALILIVTCSAVGKDPEPYFKSASMPFYPPLARQARIEGEVKLSFVVNTNGDTEDVTATAGHPILKADAVEQVKTWKFAWSSPCSCRVKQEATFIYQIKGEPIEPSWPQVTVRWFPNNRVEIETNPIPVRTTY